MEEGIASHPFRLGDWLVEPRLNRLERDGAVVKLRPKLMDLLIELSAHAGEVVAKETLIDAVWARRIVAASALSTAVAQLRRALGDDAGAPHLIESVSKRGYRMLVPAEPVGGDRDATSFAACTLLLGERRLSLGEGEHVIGRGADAGVRIDSSKISRRHARIVVRGGGATVEDLGSKNGTFVGTERLTAPRALRNGDQLLVGDVLMVFRLARSAQTTVTG